MTENILEPAPDETDCMVPREIHYNIMPFTLRKNGHLPGAGIATRGTGLITRPTIQISQTLGMRDLPKNEGGPLSWGEAWEAARWRHFACLSHDCEGVYEMTQPHSRERKWAEMVGETIIVLDLDPAVFYNGPNIGVAEFSRLIAGRMKVLAANQIPYPTHELVANSAKVGKWLRKLMGSKKFDDVFSEHDRSVCSVSYVEAVDQYIHGAFDKPFYAWTPARAVWSGPWRKRTVYKIT